MPLRKITIWLIVRFSKPLGGCDYETSSCCGRKDSCQGTHRGIVVIVVIVVIVLVGDVIDAVIAFVVCAVCLDTACCYVCQGCPMMVVDKHVTIDMPLCDFCWN